jgi:hypothetical protein
MMKGNRLIEALAIADRRLIEPFITEVNLQIGHSLFESGEAVSHCYFPCGAAGASYFVFLDDGDAVEVALVGPEGCIGGFISQGRFPAFTRGAVVNGGDFYRVSCRDLADLIRQSPGIETVFRRYADCLMAQMFQTIACNVSHSIEQRAAKWVLAIVDMTQQNSISMTQEQLAVRMGSGRSYASRVIQRFKADGLLRTRRGGIEVLDYDRLHERACDCNDLVNQHFRRLMRL